MCSEEALEEIEALIAILEEDTVEIIEHGDDMRELNVSLTPLTASEQDKQYVSLLLVIKISPDYPSTPPVLSVRNPRGLDDSAVSGLIKQMNIKCEEYIGCPVFFELIELGREFLTQRNVPVCQCIICLNNIQEDDVFMKTDCLHFFHKHCLGRYITNMHKDYEENRRLAEVENKHRTVQEFAVHCPVCREKIAESRFGLSDLLSSPPPVSESGELIITIGDDMKVLQKEMKKLFQKQKEKGGIIDLEEEGKKYLVLTGLQSSSEDFTELSPTDFSADDRVAVTSSPSHKVSTPKSSTPEDSPSHRGYAPPTHFTHKGGRGGGGGGRHPGGRNNTRGGFGGKSGGKRGGHEPQTDQPPQESKGKSHHQQRKGRGKADRPPKGDREERGLQL